jgi:ATP-dependent HslUV protease ATP-binding subunit HslU
VSWKFEEHETAAFTADLTPRQIVEMLDRHIVGQQNAKKAVANALRNRWRRRQVASPLREEIVPKNILMLGPTGCGKTEIARRLAKLADAPFVKVEATKFTEVGFHGRDVDQIIRDLVENAILMVRQRLRREHAQAINRAVEDRIIAAMVGEHASKETAASFRRLYREGELEDREIEIDVPASPQRLQPPGNDGSVQEMVIRVDRLFRGSGKGENKRKLKVSEARPLIEEHESDRFLNNESVTREAISAVEQDGIVFIDEIDKIVSSSEYRYGADASSEGVQRDLLPIIEGSVVSTKHGNVNTDYILFICSGAFHQSKPSDMLAELQGRLPVRVELKGLRYSIIILVS